MKTLQKDTIDSHRKELQDIKKKHDAEIAKLKAQIDNLASKQQVAFMLQKLVRLPKKDLPMDATDALGIAFCHHTHLLRTIITRAGENSSEMASSTENKMQLLFQKKYHQNNRVNNWTAFVRNNPDRIRSKDDK